ncbi:MAG: Hsp33 family molecular chaperone HslO [Clostridia bacterium]|nr:Hsp33 family molecular chaperone HslO [Clostridia bacterium]
MKNTLRTLIFNGQVSLTVADTTEIVREGIRLHRLSQGAAIVFGKALSAMTFASASLKEETGEISLSVQSDGAGGSLGISGNRALRLRGYIENAKAEGDEKTCWGKKGALTIIRDDGYNRPFVGACAFPENGGVDEAFEEYYRISEQLPTRIATTVELQENGDCAFAGAIALQPLPFAEQETLDQTANAPLDEILQELKRKGVEDCVRARFDIDESVWDLRKAEYKCNCSKRYLSRVLVTLGEEELRRMIEEDGKVKVHCHYCNKDYEFTSEDADALFPRKCI